MYVRTHVRCVCVCECKRNTCDLILKYLYFCSHSQISLLRNSGLRDTRACKMSRTQSLSTCFTNWHWRLPMRSHVEIFENENKSRDIWEWDRMYCACTHKRTHKAHVCAHTWISLLGIAESAISFVFSENVRKIQVREVSASNWFEYLYFCLVNIWSGPVCIGNFSLYFV